MLRNLNRSQNGRRILGSPFVGLLASQILAETATGDNGRGLLYSKAQDYPGRQLTYRLTGYNGTLSALTLFENGSFLVGRDEEQGNHTISFDWSAYTVDGSNVITGSDTATILVGNVDATAPAANLTGPGTIQAGQPVDNKNASAPAANVTGASTINAGQATGGSGNVDAAAPAANVTGAGTIQAGQPVDNKNATAPAANVTGPGTINAGQATGGNNNVDAAAPAANVTGPGTIQAGQPADNKNATAPSATVTGTSTIHADPALGDRDASAPAANVTGTGTIQAGQAQGVQPEIITPILRAGIKPRRLKVGDAIVLDITIEDEKGNRLETPSVAVKLKPPKAPLQTPTASRRAKGSFAAEIALDKPGRWYWRVEITTPENAVAEGTLNVKPSRFMT